MIFSLVFSLYQHFLRSRTSKVMTHSLRSLYVYVYVLTRTFFIFCWPSWVGIKIAIQLKSLFEP